MRHGFITYVSLHYVRKQCLVPIAFQDYRTLEVTGLVKRPVKLSMHQLVNKSQSLEFSVSLVCAVNRHKEQNKVKQMIGFNWVAAGVSTSLWRGVTLFGVIKRSGIFGKKHGLLNVCFELTEDLPGGGGSKYDFIRGRMMELLKRIVVKDNRILHSHLDAEVANAEDNETVGNDNSVVNRELLRYLR
ncbi:nitrate reductase [NADH]-like [Hibiscus syriacus]|uniref:nitrate reductase [NADH]-like n=1 Tax=Hibiscus syriacus TaxID=106335 RepID=UPI001921A120|nr:nitrate reductase [NADH]-like [Hibiscus syriacus]